MTCDYYCVVAKTAPWNNQVKQTVGCYLHYDTALKVAELIREINMPEINGGIDVTVDTYRGEMVECPSGIRLKEMPMGCITIIQSSLDRAEYRRLVDMTFKTIKLEQVKL